MKKIFCSAITLFAFATIKAQTTIYTGDGTLSSNRTVTMSGKNLTVKASNAVASFFINGTNGNVGINTLTPTEALDVNGNVKGKAGLFNNYGVDGQNFANSPAKFKNGLALSAGNIVSSTIGTGTLAFYDIGSNTTAGVAEPGFVWFELNNRNYNTRLRFVANENSVSQFTLFDKTQTTNFQVYDNPDGAVGLIMPKSNSYVGIGTTSFFDGTDTYALSVKGNVRANRVKVYTTWADYVFEDNYELPTLNEVETYINENGHLKDIPSAAEVEAKGIELGEMNKLLLQKVEELTLYMIDQNKINAQQTQQIEELKVQVKNLSEKK